MQTGGGQGVRGRRTGVGELAVEAGLSLIREGGFDALTMKQVAAATGLRPPALHWYFKDRVALLKAVAARSLRDLPAPLAEAPPLDQLDALVADALVHLPAAAAVCGAFGSGPMPQWDGAAPLVAALTQTIERFGGPLRVREIALAGVLAMLVGAATGLIGDEGDDALQRTIFDIQLAVRALVIGACGPSEQTDTTSRV